MKTLAAAPAPDCDEVPGRQRVQKDDAAFRSIGEAAAELGLKPHVLRFWETRFEALKPMKRADGRRHYRPEDMELLRRLKAMLYDQGLTIRGAIRALEEPGVSAEEAAPAGPSVRDLQETVRQAVERGEFRGDSVRAVPAARERLESLLEELEQLKDRLDRVRSAKAA